MQMPTTQEFDRIIRLFDILLDAAESQKRVPVGEIASLLSLGRGGSARYLHAISFFCRISELPDLSVLAVGANTGVPGPSYAWPREDVEDEVFRVHNHDWAQVKLARMRVFGDRRS